MLKKWVNRPLLFLVVALSLFLSLTFTSPLKDTHVLFNLEPYPDGLFYVHAARNLILHQKWEVSYEGYLLHPRITPTYPLLLALGYFISSSPQMFYWTNILLGIFTIVFLFLILRKITRNPLLIGTGLLIYLLHGYVYWLPSAPMAENAALFLFTASVWAVLRKKQTLISSAITASLLVIFFLTKYNLVGPTSVLAVVFLWRLLKDKKWKELSAAVSVLLLGAAFFLWYQMYIQYYPLNEISTPQFVFYSLNYFGHNTMEYLLMLIGTKAKLLWLQYPLTTIGLSGVFLVGNLFLFFKRKDRHSLLWLLLFASQFPILLVFYVVDARYIVLTLPLLSIGITYVVEKLEKQRRAQWLYVILTLALLLQLISQLSFFKYLIATNLLGRSTAWQYEAVKVFNAEFESSGQKGKPYLITAMPPLFIDIYSNHKYELLPLSPTQEFADKQQFVWGRDVLYEDLGQTYMRLLVERKEVFLTNAYLTSQHEFKEYFQEIEKRFVIEEVSQGCLGTCNVWKVKLRLIVD